MPGIGLIKSERKLKRKINMTNGLFYISVFIFGLLSGLVYFGGLRLTVKKLSACKRPVLLFLISFWGRFLIAGLCFYHIARIGNWVYILICLAGFISIRIVLLRFLSCYKL